MATVKQMFEKFKKVNLKQLTAEALRENDTEILDLNREQMFYGKLADGTNISPPYSPLTINEKLKKNQISDRVTLKDTGSFQRLMKMNVTSNRLTIDSSDGKTKKLENKYSIKIFGLTTSGKKEAWLICKAAVVIRIKQITGVR